MNFQAFLRKFLRVDQQTRIENALALHRRGEVRNDGLTLLKTSQHLHIEWRARLVHPWDRRHRSEEQERLFIEQCYADTDSALGRLFHAFPDLDAIQFRVVQPDSDKELLTGSVARLTHQRNFASPNPRLKLWRAGVRVFTILTLIYISLSGFYAMAQPQQPPNSDQASASTSTDLFVMLGSDFDRPGLVSRANYNIGIGHTFKFLKKDPIGDELTFGYTYENAGMHGFFHTKYGEHTESLGIMKNFILPKTKAVTGYTWIQSGITSYTGYLHILNRLDSGASVGVIIHTNFNSSIWVQESYNKVVTVPWYTTTSIGYTYSW
jgi:hypothetical protein